MKCKIIIYIAILVTEALTYHHGWPPSYSTYNEFQYQNSWDWYNQFYYNQHQPRSQQNVRLVQNPNQQWDWNYPGAYNPHQTWNPHPQQIIKNQHQPWDCNHPVNVPSQHGWDQNNGQLSKYPLEQWNQDNDQFNSNAPQQNWNQNNDQFNNNNPQQSGNQPNGQLNKDSSKPSLDNFFEQLNRNLEDATQKPLKPAPMYNATNNPCVNKNANPPPDFRSFGRRISQIKCLEYIWEIRTVHLDEKQDKDCTQYQKDYEGGRTEVLVVGGRLAEAGEFPHMGALGWKTIDGNWVFKCGGTIISPKFMLTAAHCQKIVRDSNIPNPQPEIIRLGAKNLERSDDAVIPKYPADVKIVRFIPHPNYASPSQYFDIALIELETAQEFNANVQAACLWNNLDTSPLGTMVSASGWGVTEINGRMSTTELRVGDIELIDTNTCSGLVKCSRNFCGLRDHQVCAGKLEGGVDTCQGDSGGPLQVPIKLPSALKRKMYYLVGITSTGPRCALANSPGVYTRVASFTDWIESIVWKDELARGQ